jgi:protein-disulfide isomerase
MTVSGNLSRLLCLLGSAAAIAACNPPPPKEKPADPKACTEYATKLCAEMGGDEAPNCVSTKATLDLLPPSACAAGLKDVAFTKSKLGDARKKCDELVTKLCAEIGDKTQTCEMVRTQTKTFPPERCDMMMGRYAEVLADLKKMESRNQPLPAEKLAEIAGGAEVPSFGPVGAKVTIVEFSDFQCPFCTRAATASHQVKEKYGDKVRFVFRQFPLSFHQNAHVAAEAALEAHRQGKFWELHDKMFADQQKLDRASLEATAKEIGLDMAAFKKALDDKTHAATVDAEMKLGESVSVDGTPTMFLNGKRIGNPTDFEAISKEIDAALAGG